MLAASLVLRCTSAQDCVGHDDQVGQSVGGVIPHAKQLADAAHKTVEVRGVFLVALGLHQELLELWVGHAVRNELARVFQHFTSVGEHGEILGQLSFGGHVVERADGTVHCAEQVGCGTHQRRVEADTLLDCFDSQNNLAVGGCVQQLVQDGQVVDALVLAKRCTAHVDDAIARVVVLDVQRN